MASAMAVLQRRERIKRPFPYRLNPFDLKDKLFIQKFRLSKEGVNSLCHYLHPNLRRSTRGYSVEMQVLICLRLLGTGSFQSVLGDDLFIHSSQPTVSRILGRFLEAMILITPQYIKFPTDAVSLLEKKRKFYEIAGMTGVIGAIDCTHIHLIRPPDDETRIFTNRKGRTTINVQMICDAGGWITNVVADNPGSEHDATIWNECSIFNIMPTLPHQTYLIGDKGYPLQPWLMIPYSTPSVPHEEIFNQKIVRTRVVIERTFGLLKSRFRCLDASGGVLLYSPQKVCKIVVACAVLHNICLEEDIPLPEDTINIEDDDDDDDVIIPPQVSNQALRRRGQQIRDDLALNFMGVRRALTTH